MGVISTADELKDDIEKRVNMAVNILNDVEAKLELMINPETWGGGDWSKEFRKQVIEDIDYLSKVTRKLAKIKRRY